MRDGAAHVLRCLKVWYDLPSTVLLAALNLMDRFMSRMKARPKHLSCIAISSFHLAACQWVERVKQSSMETSSTHCPLQVCYGALFVPCNVMLMIAIDLHKKLFC